MGTLTGSLLPSDATPYFSKPVAKASFGSTSILGWSCAPFADKSSKPAAAVSVLFFEAGPLVPSGSSTLESVFSPAMPIPTFPNTVWDFSVFSL